MKSINRLPKLILALAFFNIAINTYAQVGINTTNPESSSVLDITSSNRGLLIPRLTSDNRNALGTQNPANGLLVCDTTLKMFFFWNSGTKQWESLNPWRYGNTSSVNSNIVTFANDKNVGIGKEPTVKLDVNGDINAFNISATSVSGYGTVPIGCIVMWSGNINNIPSGWALCDGYWYNPNNHDEKSPNWNNTCIIQTPKLVDRFIVGAGSMYNPNDQGGANEVTLTIDQMPSHSHAMQPAGAHNHTSENFDRLLQFTPGESSTANSVDSYDATGSEPDIIHSAPILPVGDHTHIIEYAGGGQSHENRPPYYALAYIMRIK